MDGGQLPVETLANLGADVAHAECLGQACLVTLVIGCRCLSVSNMHHTVSGHGVSHDTICAVQTRPHSWVLASGFEHKSLYYWCTTKPVHCLLETSTNLYIIQTYRQHMQYKQELAVRSCMHLMYLSEDVELESTQLKFEHCAMGKERSPGGHDHSLSFCSHPAYCGNAAQVQHPQRSAHQLCHQAYAVGRMQRRSWLSAAQQHKALDTHEVEACVTCYPDQKRTL